MLHFNLILELMILIFIYEFAADAWHQIQRGRLCNIQSLIYALLGWNRCAEEIQLYEDCKKTGTIFMKDPTKCYNEARTLQICYNSKA